MTNHKNSNFKSLLILIAIISLGTVLGITAYSLILKKSPPVAAQPKKNPPEMPVDNTPSGHEIANWKTYKSQKLGIEFNYPPELFVTEENQEIIIDSLKPDDPQQQSSLGISSKMEITEDARNIQEITNEYKNNNYDNFSVEEIPMNGLKASEITFTGAYGGEIHHIILTKREIKSKTLIINYIDKKTFEQILTTLKFI